MNHLNPGFYRHLSGPISSKSQCRNRNCGVGRTAIAQRQKNATDCNTEALLGAGLEKNAAIKATFRTSGGHGNTDWVVDGIRE